MRCVLVAWMVAAGCGRIDFASLADGASADGASAYHDLTDPSNWATLDLSQVSPAANGFYGAVFDGRYVYMVPDDYSVRDGVVTRYDPQLGFTAAGWTTYDLATIDARATGFFGGVFDGRYLYLAPFENGVGLDGFAARYDTQAELATPTSWQFFDMTGLDASAEGFYGLAYDGHYIYYVPDGSGGAQPHLGLVARYDPSGAFAAQSAWQTVDVTGVDPNAKGFWGGAFDGRYIYLVPCFSDTGHVGVVARYDTQAAFVASSAWSTFDLQTVDAAAVGFAGAAFDGRYLYLVPRYSGTIARYDTQGAFATGAAWTTFDATTVSPNAQGFTGTVFDGRYVYFVPDSIGATASGTVARVDTEMPAQFASSAAWSVFDITSVDPSAKGFVGAAFDGRYIYFAPYTLSTVARFDARARPALPPRLGSFM